MSLGKKGSIQDLIYVMVGVFTFSIIILLTSLLIGNLNDKVQATDIFPTEAKSASTSLNEDYPAVTNGAILFVFFGASFVTIVLASLIPVSAIFLIFFLLALFFVSYVGGGIANAYEAFITASAIQETAANYSIHIHIFRYMPFYIFVVGIVLAIIVYHYRERRAF